MGKQNHSHLYVHSVLMVTKSNESLSALDQNIGKNDWLCLNLAKLNTENDSLVHVNRNLPYRYGHKKPVA